MAYLIILFLGNITMPTDVTTQRVVLFQSEQNGLVTCVERVIRPADIPGLFPQGAPTFPAIAPAVRHPAIPVDQAYAVIDNGLAIPRADSPNENWTAPEDLLLSKVITAGYVPGEHDTFDQAQAQYTTRTFEYKTERDTDLPDYDPDLYIVSAPTDFPGGQGGQSGGGGASGDWIINVIPRNINQSPQSVAFSEQSAVEWPPGSGQFYYSFLAQLETPFLWLWEGMTVSNESILLKGAANTAMIAYTSNAQNGGCGIYGCNPLFDDWYGVSGSQGNVSTEHLWCRATQPAGAIISHIITPAEGGSNLPPLLPPALLLSGLFAMLGDDAFLGLRILPETHDA